MYVSSGAHERVTRWAHSFRKSRTMGIYSMYLCPVKGVSLSSAGQLQHSLSLYCLSPSKCRPTLEIGSGVSCSLECWLSPGFFTVWVNIIPNDQQLQVNPLWIMSRRLKEQWPCLGIRAGHHHSRAKPLVMRVPASQLSTPDYSMAF